MGSEIFGSEYTRYRAEKSLLSATGIRDMGYSSPTPPPPNLCPKSGTCSPLYSPLFPRNNGSQENDKKASGEGWGEVFFNEILHSVRSKLFYSSPN